MTEKRIRSDVAMVILCN